MRLFGLILCFFISPLYAADVVQDMKTARLAMGFYYPSLSSVSNRTDIEVSLSYWAKELISSTFKLPNVYSVLYDDITVMSSDFQKGELDMVIAPPLLLAIHFDRKLLVDGFVGVNKLNHGINLAILARSNLGDPSPTYRGKRLILPENDLLAELLIDNHIVSQHSRPYQQIFSQVKYANKNQRIILDLFFDKADIAVVDEDALLIMTELNPQVGKKIRVLERFPMKARNYAYFHRDYQFISKLKAKAQLFKNKVRGQQILQVFQASDVDSCLVEELEPFDVFYQKYLILKKDSHD